MPNENNDNKNSNNSNNNNVVWTTDVSKHDVALVGGKGANLGEMLKADLPVPPAFILTSNAYWKFLQDS